MSLGAFKKFLFLKMYLRVFSQISLGSLLILYLIKVIKNVSRDVQGIFFPEYIPRVIFSIFPSRVIHSRLIGVLKYIPREIPRIYFFNMSLGEIRMSLEMFF